MTKEILIAIGLQAKSLIREIRYFVLKSVLRTQFQWKIYHTEIARFLLIIKKREKIESL